MCTSPPRTTPGLGPPRSWNGAWALTIWLISRKNAEHENPLLQLNQVGARSSRAAPGRSGSLLKLILFFACFLAGSFASQRGLHTFLFAGLQVKGVALDLLDDVFLLHLALKAA